MVPERDGRLIRTGFLAADGGRRRFLAAALGGTAGFQLVLRAADLRELGPRRPPIDLFIWDLFDEDYPGDSFFEDLTARLPGEPSLLLIGEDAAAAARISALGRPWGWVADYAGADAILDAAAAVASGLVAVDFELAAENEVGPFHRRPISLDDGEAGVNGRSRLLSSREQEILTLIFQGMRNREIAEALAISENTVKFHLSAVYEKLGAGSRTEAVREAMRRGLLAL